MAKLTGVFAPRRSRHTALSVLAAVSCASVFAVSTIALPGPAAAQSKPKSAKAKPAAAKVSADQAYAAGIKAYESGNSKSATTSLSSALRVGGLPSDRMAKALYYRGASYRKQGKPAQAISDLTSAIWIKGGLSDADRLAAIEERKQAYKEAGLGTDVPQGIKPGGVVQSTASASSIPTPAATPSATSDGTATSAWTTSTGEPPAPMAALSPASGTPSANTSAPNASMVRVPGAGQVPPAASAAPAPAGSSTLSNIGSSISNGVSNVGSFFSNVFSSNASPQQPAAASQPQLSAAPMPAPPSSIATSSTSKTAPSTTSAALPWQTPQTAQSAATQPAAAPPPTQGWGSSTSPTAPLRTAAVQQKPVAKPVSTSQSGQFRLQVAAVRSEDRAQEIVSELTGKYANQLAGAAPQIDAANIGNMGTFYRVRIGPYASAEQPRGLCGTLRKDGYDCLIVTP